MTAYYNENNPEAARLGRLRGYGNAIVAPQAQAFIETVMEWRAA